MTTTTTTTPTTLYDQLLERIISEGLAEVHEAYATPNEHHKRDGAIEGFEACRGKTPLELVDCWKEAEAAASKIMRDDREAKTDDQRYWRQRYKAMQIEWVCNVVSVAFVNNGYAPLLGHLPTMRGAMKYAEIVGTLTGGYLSANEGEGAIDAEEVLRMAALTYAGKLVAAVSATPPGPEAPAALDAARKILRPGNDMPAGVASALRDLQMAAAMFTLDLAEGHVENDALQQLERNVITVLERRADGNLVHTESDAAAMLGLSDRSLDYAYQIIVAEETDALPGSDVVTQATRTFQLAAVAFTIQLALAEKLDAKIPRWVEENLVALFEKDASAS